MDNPDLGANKIFFENIFAIITINPFSMKLKESAEKIKTESIF